MAITAYKRRMAAEQIDRLLNALNTPEDYARRDEMVDDLLAEWEYEDAVERAERGYDDCAQLETCDTGTGEGRWHGRI